MEDRQLKDKAIKFKGSDYVQVKDRIQYLADNYEWQYSIETNYQYFEESKTWVVRARLTIWTSVFTWLAQEVEWQGYINKTSALENAETSAVWRAIAFAWIGVIDSIASIDEINKANNRSETPYTKPIFWEKNFEKKLILMKSKLSISISGLWKPKLNKIKIQIIHKWINIFLTN